MMATPVEVAAKKLAWEVESRKSIELHLTTKATFHQADKNWTGFDTLKDDYIETAAGQRFGEFQGLRLGKVMSRSQHFGEGTRFADVRFSRKDSERQESFVIKRQYHIEGQSDRKMVPTPLLYLYVGRTPLHEALPKGLSLGTEKVMGRDCDLYLFPDVRWPVVQDQIFYLDRETAIPLKFQAFPSQKGRDRNEPHTEWIAESIDTVQGHHIPLKSTTTAFNPDTTLQFTWNHTVTSVAFDKEYPASTFWPATHADVIEHNELTGKTKAPARKSKTDKKSAVPSKEKTGSTTQPETTTSTLTASTQADPPRNGAVPLSNVSLAVGCALVLVGMFLSLNRRESRP